MCVFLFFFYFFFKSVCFSSKYPISSAAVVSLALRNWVVRGCVLSLRRYRGGCARGTQARRVERRGKRHGPRQRGREFVRVSDRVWAVSAWIKPDSYNIRSVLLRSIASSSLLLLAVPRELCDSESQSFQPNTECD